MTNCTQESFQFPVCQRRKLEANFQGGDITSNGGVLLLQQVDRHLGLTEAIARALDDPRRQASVDHDALSLLRQRVYALALGYEDFNDHPSLRQDLAIQTALGRDAALASSATLCRWENRIKEQQLDLFADRTSCHRWWSSQFRLFLSSLAYTLLEAIRRLALQGTELAKAYVGTIRLKLLKIGAIILRNTRRIRFPLSSACPDQRLFFLVADRLVPG